MIAFLSVFLISNKSKKINNNNNKNTHITTTTKKIEKIKIVDPDSNSRPIAIMINNNKAVWGYQAGIQDAYIVYEMIVEGGITRMMAIFKDKDTARVGSVRSARHYYLDYALENDDIFVHFGWSP